MLERAPVTEVGRAGIKVGPNGNEALLLIFSLKTHKEAKRFLHPVPTPSC